MNEITGLIAGMDEAGRGSWAGPVVAAAVILPESVKEEFRWISEVKDSKALTKNQREMLFKSISKCCRHGIGISSHREVDKHGLLHATYLAYKRAIQELMHRYQVHPDHLLIDGRDKFTFELPHTSIVRGDEKVPAISAASILAKVTRDKLMLEYAKKYPHYGFEKNMGYGTSRHQRALKEYGPCDLHRSSYAPIKSLEWVQNAFL